MILFFMFFLPLIVVVFLNIFFIYSGYVTYERARIQNDSLATIITNNPANYVPLSEKSKELLTTLVTEQGIDAGGLQFITCAHFQNCPQDYLTLVGTRKIFISIPDAQTRLLNEYVEKESLTLEEQKVFDEIIFFIGHETVHVKVYQSNSFLSCLRLVVKMSILQALITTSLFALLLYLTAGVYGLNLLFAYSLISLVFGYIVQKIISLITYYEELYCDTHASKNITILEAGISAMDSEHVTTVTENVLKQNIFASKILAPFSITFASAWATQHPHPKIRQQNIQKQIDYLYNK